MVAWWAMVGYNGKHVGESGKLFTTFLLTTWDGSSDSKIEFSPRIVCLWE
jgi:hypothetical protein